MLGLAGLSPETDPARNVRVPLTNVVQTTQEGCSCLWCSLWLPKKTLKNHGKFRKFLESQNVSIPLKGVLPAKRGVLPATILWTCALRGCKWHKLNVRECPSRLYVTNHRRRRSDEDDEYSSSSSLSLHRFMVTKPLRGNTSLSWYPKMLSIIGFGGHWERQACPEPWVDIGPNNTPYLLWMVSVKETATTVSSSSVRLALSLWYTYAGECLNPPTVLTPGQLKGPSVWATAVVWRGCQRCKGNDRTLQAFLRGCRLLPHHFVWRTRGPFSYPAISTGGGRHLPGI